HGLSDQSDALLSAPEALGVEFGVLAHHHVIRNRDAGVDYRFCQTSAPADLRIGQYDRLVDSRIEECTRTPVNSSDREIAAPEITQPPETSEEMATPRRPSTSCTNLAGGVISP